MAAGASGWLSMLATMGVGRSRCEDAASLRYNRSVGRRVAAAALIVEGDSPCVYLVSPS